MKAKEIIETLRGPNFDSTAEEFGKMNQKRWLTNGKHIGDIENYKVLQNGIHYSLWSNDTLVAFTSLKDSNNEVDDVWVNADYRQQKIFSKILWFYKTRLHRSKLILGPVHSETMQEVVKGLSRFEKSWVNIRTNEVMPFDAATLDNFYSRMGITAWRLMLENNGDFTGWPMFNTGSSFIKENYSNYLD